MTTALVIQGDPTENWDDLTDAEADRLAELEDTIHQLAEVAYIEIGNALREIRDDRLWRCTPECGYESFELYCEDRFGWGLNYSNKIIRAANTAAELGTGSTTPPTETMARELGKVKDAKVRTKLWARLTKDGTQTPTIDKVRKAVAKAVPPKPPNPAVRLATKRARALDGLYKCVMDAAKLEWGTEPASHHVVVEWRNVSTALLAIVESMGDGVDNAEEVTDEWDPIEGNGLLLKDDRGEVTPGDPKSLTLLKINEDGTFDVEANDGSAWADVPEGPPTQVRSEDVVGWVDAPIAVGDIIFGRGKDGTHGKLQVTKIGAKRLSVVPVDFEWSTHPKTVRSDYVERYVEGQHTENLIPPPPTELYCETCDRVVDEGDAEPGYECGDCGTEFTRENSADGDSNQCPDCNKFASRSETPYCPDCAEQLTEHLSCQGKESP